MKIPIKHIDWTLVLVVIISLFFSIWLMFSTFSYQDGSMIMASKVWSDFAANIPLIRSFSFGLNFPPEYPIFPGSPIRYHFLFYFLVGMLEKLGLSIDFALNIPSVIGFTALLVTIYIFTKLLFNSSKVALLTLLLFLFNGTFSFVYFLSTRGFSKDLILEIINLKKFPTFGPYDGGIISAFWNLNIYTNQRHLSLAYALSLLVIFFFTFAILKDKKPKLKTSILIGILLGFFVYFHMVALLITFLVLGGFFIFFSQVRLPIILTAITAAIIALPQYLYMQSGEAGFKILFTPGYLVSNNFNLFNFTQYWSLNLGLHLALIPLGFFLANTKLKKIFLSFFIVFLIGNTIQFSPEIAANHKFFNYFLILGASFSAYSLVYIWQKLSLLRPLVVISVFLLTFSGIIDFFPIYNDSKITLEDYPKNPDIAWIAKNTPPQSVFLNTIYIYDPASLAGRKIFLGWPYFAWSAGYNTKYRSVEVKNILQETDHSKICQFLLDNKIDYISISKPSEDFPFNPLFWQLQFQPLYQGKEIAVFDKGTICRTN